MPRTLVVSGTTISHWAGVEVWQGDNNHFVNITNNWSWSNTPHQHYEVAARANGSYWVPASTNPPHSWGGSKLIVGTNPPGAHPVNSNNTEYRPDTTYFWIPNASIPVNVAPGQTTNSVVCGYPTSYPPPALAAANPTLGNARRLLAEVSGSDAQSSFQDKDGLISFVNLSSGFVTNNPEFKVGQNVCDKISNFFATLRIKVFSALSTGKVKPLPGDVAPTTQWDPAVTHYMQYMLSQAGGLTNFSIVTETYSVTQLITEFSTSFVQLIFDAAVVPEAVITDVANFLQGVGSSLRASWDDKSRSYQNTLLGQCHEAVPEDSSGQNFRYFPKIKFYYIKIDSSQTAFTTPCASAEYITFNFTYESYVTGLNADVLDPTSKLYADFVTGFLDEAQAVNYKNAKNNLNTILGDTSSDSLSFGRDTSDANVFGVDIKQYPLLTRQPPSTIERLLNTRAA